MGLWDLESLGNRHRLRRSLDDVLRGYTHRHRLAFEGVLFPRVMLGYLQSLRQLALCGNNIVVEAVITASRLTLYLDLFGDLPVLLVGLHIPLDEAHRRERQRTDRLQPYEVTADDIDAVHSACLYDLELDMVQLAPGDAARHVLTRIASPPEPTAFQRLVTQRADSQAVETE